MEFSDLTSILIENYGALIAETVVQEGPGNWLIPGQSIMGRLKEAGQTFLGGADNNDRHPREWGVHHSTAAAVAIDQNDPWPTATQEGWNEAALAWKRIAVTMDFDNLVRLATRKNAARGGMSPISDDFKRKLKAIVHKIESDLATDGTGTAGKDVTGCKAFLSTANTYAGINQAAATYWQSTITAAGAAALSFAFLDTMTGGVYDRNGIGPRSELWMGRTQWKRYVDLFTTNLRYTPGGSGAQSVEPFYDNGLFSLPIQRIQGIPNDEVWLVNLDELELRYLDHVPSDMLSEIKDEQVMHSGIPVGFEQVQTGKDKKSIALKCYVQLCCTNPFHTGAITGLAT